MIPNIYSIPGLFRLSTVIFTIPDRSQPQTVDDRGNPQRPTRLIAVTMQLDGSGVRSLQTSETYGGTSQSAMTYEGHLAIPDSEALQQLEASLPDGALLWMSDKLPPDLVEGTTAEGSINGQDGTLRLLPIEQTSLEAPYQAGFGDRVRIEFTRRQQWQSS